MLKSWAEMLKVDVDKYVKTREAKDDKGRKVDIPYLPWAACVKLLYDNGAENVFFEPLTNENGSSLFMSDKEFTDKYGTTNRCYEVAVRITYDDKEFIQREPLMNGSNPVKDNSLNQHRIGNAQKRAFVKGIALKTGLGFNLWLNEANQDDNDNASDDKSWHSLKAIKERQLEKITELMKRGYTSKEIAQECGYDSDDDMRAIMSYFKVLQTYESKLNEMLSKGTKND